MKLIITLSLTTILIIKIILSNRIVKNPYIEGSKSNYINKIRYNNHYYKDKKF